MLNEERYSVYREILSQEMNGMKIVLAIFGVLLVVVLVILFIQIKKFRDRMHAVENKKKSKKKKEKSQKPKTNAAGVYFRDGCRSSFCLRVDSGNCQYVYEFVRLFLRDRESGV